jgi:superfamily II DNA helicase RecQ
VGGHDFRPEYRKLAILREALPGVPIGTYTATATEQVRRDIAEHLKLDRPEILVGVFDRPNLIYRVRRRLARERHVPAYIIFGDVTLRDMARQRLCTPQALLRVSGIGMQKLVQYGERILEIKRKHTARRQHK